MGKARDRLRACGWLLVVLGVIAVAVGSFLPWVWSGAASRDSFEVVRAARRLGVVDSDLLSGGLVLWYFVPLFAATTLLLVALRRERLAGAAAGVLGVVVLVVGLMVLSSSADVGSGPAVSSTAGAATALGGLVVLGTGRRAGSGGTT